MPAGAKVLPYRSNIPKISEFCFGAVDETFSTRAKAAGQSIIIGGSNYGQGSSREHAALVPLSLGIKAVIAKSFARIHETNLKKQGVLALTFCDPSSYDSVREDDLIDVRCAGIQPGSRIEVLLHHSDGTTESFLASHTYNRQQLEWFSAGSALNSLNL